MERAKRYLKPLAAFNAVILVCALIAFASVKFLGGSKSNPVFSFVQTPGTRSTAPEAGGSPSTSAGDGVAKPAADKKGG
jgi:hypothetical protein